MMNKGTRFAIFINCNAINTSPVDNIYAESIHADNASWSVSKLQLPLYGDKDVSYNFESPFL